MRRLAGGASLLLLLLAAVPARAEPSPALQDCLAHVVDNEHGSRWPAVVICYETELDAQDRRLQSLYRALEAAAPKLGGPALEQVAASRRQWALYRDSWCAFEQDHAIAPNADIARLDCRIEVTRTQADRMTGLSLALH